MDLMHGGGGDSHEDQRGNEEEEIEGLHSICMDVCVYATKSCDYVFFSTLGWCSVCECFGKGRGPWSIASRINKPELLVVVFETKMTGQRFCDDRKQPQVVH